MTKKWWEAFRPQIFPALAALLSGDLLYLYFSGAWYVPIKWIEYLEVFLLVAVTVGGIGAVVIKVKRLL